MNRLILVNAKRLSIDISTQLHFLFSRATQLSSVSSDTTHQLKSKDSDDLVAQ